MSKEKKDFVFDLNAITYEEVQRMDLMNKVEQEEYSIMLVIKALRKWPYDVEMTEDNIRGLGLLDFVALQRAFSNELNDAFKSGGETE